MQTPSSGAVTTQGFFYGALMLVFVFALVIIGALRLGAGWWWDIAGGIGFVALAFFGLLNLATGQGPRLASHRALGWWALGLVVVHAALYLIDDSVVVHHLKLAAPPAMLVGIAVLFLAAFGAVISLPRWKLRAHGSRDNFRRYHRLMSWTVLVGSLYHIAATAHSVHHLGQLVLLGGGMFLVLLLAGTIAPKLQATVSVGGLVVLSVAAVGCYAALRNV